MSTVSPADEQQMRRWRVSPDRLLAWLGVTGLTCYGALWVVHQSFYNPFAVSVFMVGVGQAQMLTLAAVYALLAGATIHLSRCARTIPVLHGVSKKRTGSSPGSGVRRTITIGDSLPFRPRGFPAGLRVRE